MGKGNKKKTQNFEAFCKDNSSVGNHEVVENVLWCSADDNSSDAKDADEGRPYSNQYE